MSITAWLLIVAPATLLVLWCFAYFVGLIDELLSPGVPFVYSYEAEAGTVTISAQRYHIDWRSRQVFAFNVSMLRPSGQRLLFARSITATWRNPAIEVDARRVTAHILREVGGRFSLEDIFPKVSAEKGGIPFAVHVDTADVEYVDQTRGIPLAHHGLLLNTAVSGIGDRFIASSHARIDGVGVLPLRLARSATAFQLVTNLNGADLAPLLPHLDRWLIDRILSPWRPYGARNLIATGPIAILVDRGKPLVQASLGVVARDLNLATYLRGASIKGMVSGFGTYLRLRLASDEMSRKAMFDGSLAWDKVVRLGGRLSASAASERVMWPPLRKLLPKESRFQNAMFEGWISVVNKAYQVDGRLVADSIRWTNEMVGPSAWLVSLDSQALRARSERATWEHLPVQAAIDLDYKGRTMKGFAKLPKTRIESVLAKFHLSGMRGLGTLDAVIGGTYEKPQIAFRSSGLASYRFSDGRLVNLGLYEARANFDKTGFMLAHLVASGPNGVATANGRIDLKSKRIAMKVRAGGVSLASLGEDIDGLGFVEGTVKGTLDKPIASGALEVYGARYHEESIPVIAASFLADSDHLEANDVDAAIGSASAHGRLTWTYRTKEIGGIYSAQNVQLEDWFGPDVAGLAASQGKISGTIDRPQLEGSLDSNRLVVYGIPASATAGSLVATKEKVILSAASLNIDEGLVKMSGEYQFQTGQGMLDATFANLPLARIPSTTPDIQINGKASGTLHVALQSKQRHEVDLSSKLADVTLNGKPLGNGNLSAAFRGHEWTGGMTLGELHRLITVENARYNEETKNLQAQVGTYNFPLAEARTILDKTLADASPKLQEAAQSFNGFLTANLFVDGPVDNPNVTFNNLSASDLKLYGRDAGHIDAKLSRIDRVWTLGEVNWLDKNMVMRAHGTIEEKGQTAVNGEISNFDLSWLGTVFPESFALAGSASSSFSATGNTSDPQIRATLDTKDLGVLTADRGVQSLPLSVQFENLSYANKTLSANGSFAYEGFAGKITGTAPWETLFPQKGGAGSSGEMIARLDLSQRDIRDVQGISKNLDPKSTSGVVGGWAELRGTLNDYKLAGHVGLEAPKIAFKGYDTSLTDAALNLDLEGSQIKLKGGAASSAGGSFTVDASSKMADLFAPDQGVGDFLANSLLQGSIQAKDLSAKESDGSKKGANTVTINGSVAIGGSLKEPKLATPNGPILVHGLDIVVPSDLQSRTASAVPFINPNFDNIQVRIDDQTPAKLRTTTATLNLFGGGTIAGSLQYPNVTAQMLLDSGIFRLPTARVTLEEGGTINFSYRSDAYTAAEARLDIDLEGRTNVTAPRFTDAVERYDVNLRLTGNLLEEISERDRLHITASSDPPDLSQEQILALLGQKDLIEGLARATITQRTGSELRDAFYGVAVPNLLNPITSNLASSLGLDYLDIEYNAFDGPVINASKSLGKGLTLTARRQLLESVHGKTKYDFRLVYRLPVKNRLLNRVRFGIGFDQDRPYKLTVDYSIRF